MVLTRAILVALGASYGSATGVSSIPITTVAWPFSFVFDTSGSSCRTSRRKGARSDGKLRRTLSARWIGSIVISTKT